MKIEIDVKEAKLKNVNLRSEGSGDGRSTAMDLDFEMVCPAGVARSLLGADEMPKFWGEDGEPLYHGIDSIKSWAEMHDGKLEFDGIEVPDGCKFKKFSLAPVSGSCLKLSLQAQIHPTDEQIVAFSHRQQGKGALFIGSDQQDLFE